MTPKELQFTANFLYLSYAITILETKVRQFSTPISRLNQSVRVNIATHKNSSEELTTLKTLLERLSYVTGARSIYMETLSTWMNSYNDNKTPAIQAALESIQLNAQTVLRAWADEKTKETAQQLKKSSESITENITYLQQASLLYKNMSVGKTLIEIPEENEKDKSILIFDIILKSNPELFAITDNITNTFNETSDYGNQIITAGGQVYKDYYTTIHTLISLPTFDKQYATTMFGMHDVLPEEYKSILPDVHHVFEHVLQTTKLYTQTELLSQ